MHLEANNKVAPFLGVNNPHLEAQRHLVAKPLQFLVQNLLLALPQLLEPLRIPPEQQVFLDNRNLNNPHLEAQRHLAAKQVFLAVQIQLLVQVFLELQLQLQHPLVGFKVPHKQLQHPLVQSKVPHNKLHQFLVHLQLNKFSEEDNQVIQFLEVN